jgi:hypothetical protein
MKKIAIALVLGALPGAANAQAAQALTVATIATPASQSTLRAGTAIPMRTMVELTTLGKQLRVGQRVPLEVAEAVTLNGQLVIPAGTPGMGEITSVRNKGMWGKSGALNARVLYLRVGDRQVRLSGTFDDKGKTGTGGVVAAVAFLPVAGFFTTGTSAKIPLGAPVSAFLDEDVPVMLAATTAQPAPLIATSMVSQTIANKPASKAPGDDAVIVQQ